MFNGLPNHFPLLTMVLSNSKYFLLNFLYAITKFFEISYAQKTLKYSQNFSNGLFLPKWFYTLLKALIYIDI